MIAELAPLLALGFCVTSPGPSLLLLLLLLLVLRLLLRMRRITFCPNIPTPAGQVIGAPVLGYVFATNIAPSEVGFQDVQGILVLAVTSHPDFDDTPNFDENLDRDYANDGGTYHVHWAVLVEDAGSGAGLSVPSLTDRS